MTAVRPRTHVSVGRVSVLAYFLDVADALHEYLLNRIRYHKRKLIEGWST